MKSKWIALLCLLVSPACSSFAQESQVHYLALDWSFAFFNSKPTDIDQIRGSVATFSAESSDKGLLCISFRGSTGFKLETLRLNDKIGLATGIRFLQFVQNTGKWNLLTEGTNYFYFLYGHEGLNTQYARIKSIMQTSTYLGVPVEFSFYPLVNPGKYRIYLKAGAEIDFRLHSQTNINFVNESMESYEDLITSRISSPSFIGFNLYNCIGIRVGEAGKPSLSLEAFIPVFNLHAGSPGLLTNRWGGGLQFHWHIPIQSKNL